MGDELVAGAAQLVGVALAGELEGVRDSGAVDRRGRRRSLAVAGRVIGGRRSVELLDDREEIVEEVLVL
ncbi:MAG TPA: hypothetical protein VFP23_06135 [Solirubrobacterales bacterium]|nr:hypothetical protein [Solirubrobacterales bacterium]